MSQAPVLPPADADSTRGGHFSALMHGRAAGYAIALAILGAATLAIVYRNAYLLVAAPVAVTVVVAIAFMVADKRAAQDFFTAFAAAHGFTYAKQYNMVGYTPLLSAGDRRHCEHCMKGPLRPGQPLPHCALANYTFEVKHQRTDSEGHRHTEWEAHDFAICVVEIEAGMRDFPGVFLTSNLGFLSSLDDSNWLRGRDLSKTELESMELGARYDLLIDPAQDEVKLRELFSPSFIVWLSGHPLKPCIEYRAGTLVVYVDRHLEDGGHLQWLLEATREIVARFETEIGETPARPPIA